MTRLIAIANQKGGVGKTTTAVNLACGAARFLGPDRVLLVDIDPQANTTHVMLGVEMAAGPRRADVPTVREVLIGDVSAEAALQYHFLPNLSMRNGFILPPSTIHIIPAHLELATLEPVLTAQFRGEYSLRKALTPMIDQYDMIIIDCPPSLGSLTLNALLFCEEVVIPVSPGEFALVGLGLLQRTIQQAQEANPRLRISGVLPNAIGRTRLSTETQQALQSYFGDLVLPSIPNRVAIGEAHSSGGDIFSYSPNSSAAFAYIEAVEALIGEEMLQQARNNQ